MSQTAEQERTALDDFARSPMQQGELVPVATYLPPAGMQHGALQVQVERDTRKIRARLREAASQLAERAYYRWSVKNRKKGTVDWIEGLSIKGANALVMAIGNCRADIPVVEDRGTEWWFHAILIDYETGTELGRVHRQRKNTGTMGDDPERRTDIAFQIGQSKALRNVIVNGYELDADFLLREAKQQLVEQIGRDVDRYRRITLERLAERSIPVGRAEAVIGRAAKDWVATDINHLRAMLLSIDDGMATVRDSFPPLPEEEPEKNAAEVELDTFVRTAPSPDAPRRAGAEAAGAGTTPQPPAATRKEAIDKMLAIATERALDLHDKLANLDAVMPLWQEALDDPAFVKALFDVAAKVARGDRRADLARQELEALP